MSPRIGALFAGYGGLDMAVSEVYGGELAWYSDCCKFGKDGVAGHHEPHRSPCSILAHHFPDVPNHGDVTRIDWAAIEPVDILTGGSPCQDLSHAGKRKGMTEGTRSNLWVAMREGIAQLRPSLVIWENVRGAGTAEADSELVADPRLLAGVRRRDDEPVLRALGRVLGDLSDLGYDAGWHGLLAADAGAPHPRFRYFVVARDASRHDQWHDGLAGDDRARGDEEPPGADRVATDPGGVRRGTRWPAVTGEAASGRALGDVAGRGLLPTPTTRDHKGHNQRRDETCLTGALLPTPAVNDMGAAYTPETWDAWCAVQQEKHGNGNGHGKSLAIEAQRLLPTPRTQNNENRQSERYAGEDGNYYGLLHNPDRWGDYAPAIARWETALGRPAPAPTMTSKKGNPQLSPIFVEWLMGLPAGWVTDTPGITRNEALKALGNGVVPQQCAAALRYLASVEVAA